MSGRRIDRMAARILVAGAIFGALAVMLGAFGAHALEARVTEARLATFETAVQYHMYHALALLGTGLLAVQAPSPRWLVAAWLFALGIVLFAGSLYALVLLDATSLAMITPFGGVAFIAGWAVLAWAALRPDA